MTTIAGGRGAKSPGRALNVTLWVLQVLLAALFASAGIQKILGQQPEVVASFARIGLGDWFRYFTGALELAGAIGLLVPRLSGLAAIELAGVMVGAVLIHVFFLPPAAIAVIPGTLAAVFAFIARARWPQTRAIGAELLGGSVRAARVTSATASRG